MIFLFVALILVALVAGIAALAAGILGVAALFDAETEASTVLIGGSLALMIITAVTIAATVFVGMSIW